MYQESVSIPLIIAGSDIAHGTCDTPVSLLDLSATIPAHFDVAFDCAGRDLREIAAEPVDPRALAAGAVQVNFASDAAGTFIEDRCVGEVVVSGEPPDVQASGACALQGPLAAFFGAGPHSVDIVGGPEGGQFVLDLAGNPFESDWTGDVEGPAVYGAFDGIAPIVSDLGTADVWFAGGFHVDATP